MLFGVSRPKISQVLLMQPDNLTNPCSSTQKSSLFSNATLEIAQTIPLASPKKYA